MGIHNIFFHGEIRKVSIFGQVGFVQILKWILTIYLSIDK